MSKHTPGPWVAVARTNAYIEIEAPGQPSYSAKKVATVSLTNHEANARLIATAPELLEALRNIADCCDEEHAARDYASRQAEIRGIARAAIAKAEGAPA